MKKLLFVALLIFAMPLMSIAGDDYRNDSRSLLYDTYERNDNRDTFNREYDRGYQDGFRRGRGHGDSDTGNSLLYEKKSEPEPTFGNPSGKRHGRSLLY